MTSTSGRERTAGDVSELVAQCLEQISAGNIDALESICRAHPTHEGDLRERFKRLAKLGLIGEPATQPEMIGPFIIVGMLGRGGMGQVFLGRQERPVRRLVAVKVVAAELEREETLARFESERQVLAGLNHPGISRVLEAGTTKDGRPWFAMEFVDGSPITSWCDTRQLDIDARLKLFLQTCDAMTFAHQNGVLHRDLKPGNVLVTESTGEAGVKIIDFGLAKALDQSLADTPDLTRAGQIMGTPAYMSPEQAGAMNLPIDTRTDVWALGVMLYELICGGMPFDYGRVAERGFVEFQRILAHDTAALPSVRAAAAAKDVAEARRTNSASLVSRLRGDLDAIALQALANDPTERYASVSQLAEDVRRHLTHDVVSASAPSLITRWRKFVRRRGRVAIAGTLGVIGIVIAPFVMGAMFLKSERALRDFDVVADSLKLERLIDAAENDLFPASPTLVPEVDAWRDQLDALTARVPLYEEITRELEARRDDAGAWGSPRDELLAVQLGALRSSVEAALAEGGVRNAMDARRTWSSRIADVTLEDNSDAWRAAIADIANEQTSPWYGGLQLPPQLGMVPLGRNPNTQLWEFAFLQDGEVLPNRGSDCRWLVEDETCLVFVLVPGGTITIGSQDTHPDRPRYVEDAREAELFGQEAHLASFFLSCFEMSQGQWQRAMGHNPSTRVGPRRPAETVSWEDSRRTVERLGLSLPTAAQWEYAARAGKSSLYWWGDDARDVPPNAVNTADSKHYAKFASGDDPFDTWYQDDWVAHAPVDSGLPNAFGLHHVLGNVWEWCRDRSARWSTSTIEPGDGRLIPHEPWESAPHSGTRRDARGGSFRSVIAAIRSTERLFQPQGSAIEVFGVRPSKAIAP